MDYYLYKKTCCNKGGQDKSDLDVRVFCPKPWKPALDKEDIGLKTYLVRMSFWLSTRGKFKIFYVLKDHKIAHTSYQIPKCGKFAFMKKGDLEIGPCETKDEFRGQGIYPKVINHITSSAQSTDTVFYMLVAEDNLPSIRGIEKAGFVRCGTAKKSGILKRYRLIDGDCNE